MNSPFLLTCFGLLVAAQAVHAATTIELTTNVLVRDTMHFGVNLRDENYYDRPILKMPDVLNFEGVLYRQCHEGHLFADGFGSLMMASNTMAMHGWDQALSGGTYRILGGQFHNTTGTIVAVVPRLIRTWRDSQSNEQAFFVFDRPVALPPGEMVARVGLLTENVTATNGSVQRSHGSYWMTTSCTLQQGDISPDSWGYTALRMDGSSSEASFRMSRAGQNMFDNNGDWVIRLRAKTVSGTPQLRITTDGGGAPVETVPLSGTWQNYTVTSTLASITGSTHPTLCFRVTGGAVLVDDLAVEKLGFQNPTVFTDDLITLLNDLQPGILRQSQMGGNTLSNSIMPPQFAAGFLASPWDDCDPYEGPGPRSFGMHEFYELCEYIGCQPWYSLPGTLHPWEMNQYMEYIGAPANVGMGKLRAALGHPAPWTETLNGINVEFGNEAWNNFGPFLAGGFNRMDYWSNLIVVAKASPYYRTNVLFHTAGQNFVASMARRIIGYATNCDRYAIAPYILSRLNQSDLALNDTDAKLFRWLFSYPLMSTYSNGLPQQLQVSRDFNTEFSLYEMNHHTTSGDAPLAPRNKLVASLGGGINVLNTMLAILKTNGIRRQCIHTFCQRYYNQSGIGYVRLWGTRQRMSPDPAQARPTGLALTTVNRVIGGDLVATVHSGDEPTFTAHGRYQNFGDTILTTAFPTLHSYAFQDGARRGLVIVNLDVESNQTVRLQFDEAVLGNAAARWLLTSSSITNDNEDFSIPPKVVIQESTVSGFTNGVELALPPHSLQSYEWMVPEGGAVVAAVVAGLLAAARRP
jgi:hypothetical protein